MMNCKRSKNEPLYFAVPVKLKDVGLFQKGSYWIFQNDTTGVLDCTYISHSPIDSIYIDRYNNSVENIYMPLQSRIFGNYSLSGNMGELGYPGYPFFMGLLNYYSCMNRRTAFLLYNDTVTNHAGKHAEGCYGQNGNDAIYDGDSYYQEGLLPLFELNNNLFDSVSITNSVYKTTPYNSDSIKSYFCPHKGIIKVIFKVDTLNYRANYYSYSWSLVRFHVVQ